MAGSGSTGDILRRRLSVQRLIADPMPTATEVVRLLCCVQSQEYAHAFWSLGMRTAGCSYADVRSEFDSGQFVRTHILRPTWHFVTRDDIRWILRLVSPRVQQLNRSRYRELGLDQGDLDRATELITAALAAGNHLTRAEIGTVLEGHGLSCAGQRLAYLVMNAELEGQICSGPIRGAQHTYAVLDERVPPGSALSPDDALGELVRRFFEGHGPASLKDFTRWSSVRMADARSGLDLVADRLDQMEVDGEQLWLGSATSPSSPREPGDSSGTALLLPLYDEVTLSYPMINFPVAPGHPKPPGTDRFVGTVVVDEVNVGTWRRTVKGGTVLVETDLAPRLSPTQRSAVREAVVRLAEFLGKRLELDA